VANLRIIRHVAARKEDGHDGARDNEQGDFGPEQRALGAAVRGDEREGHQRPQVAIGVHAKSREQHAGQMACRRARAACARRERAERQERRVGLRGGTVNAVSQPRRGGFPVDKPVKPAAQRLRLQNAWPSPVRSLSTRGQRPR
jgi:hypothetical protein